MTLIISLLVFTSPICVSYQHGTILKFPSASKNCYNSNGNLKHLKFLHSGIPYDVKTTSTFQSELLKSMDVNPNPGPTLTTSTGSHTLDYDPSPLPCYTYSAAFFVSLNPYHGNNLPRLPSDTWNTIKTLRINRYPINRRTKCGGRRKTWNHNKLLHPLSLDPGHEHSCIPELTTSTRLQKKVHPDQPKGPNLDNLKTLPKVNNEISSGTKVCLRNARSTRNKSVELTGYTP